MAGDIKTRNIVDLFTQHQINNLLADSSTHDPLGIGAWAEESGIPLELALALAASVLAGIAGPACSPNVPLAGGALPGLNLVARQGDHLLGQALSQLTGTLVNIQTCLRRKAGNLTVENLYSARYEGFKLRNDEDLRYMANSHDPTHSKYDPSLQLGEDLRHNEESSRMEALIHPDFLLGGSLVKNLERRLSQCHGGLGYFVGNPGALPRETARREKQVDELLRFLHGVAVKSGHPKYVTAVETRELVLSGEFTFSESDLKWLIGNRRDFLGNTLLVSSGSGAVAASDSVPETRQGDAHYFLERFVRVAKHTLGLRRAGLPQVGTFTTWAAKAEFEKQQREFLRELGESPLADLTTQAARLPALLAWTISVLGPDSGLDDYILATAVPVARRLTEAALLPYLMADNASLADERQQRARKIVERVALIQPCKARDVVRGFACQSMETYRPVIDLLIREGILQQDPKKMLSVGPVPLARLETRKLIADRLP
ncbi:MAG: hypothetical protein ABIT37_19775 [Luteolibacter sp.]